jgi:hypothetical protein
MPDPDCALMIIRIHAPGLAIRLSGAIHGVAVSRTWIKSAAENQCHANSKQTGRTKILRETPSACTGRAFKTKHIQLQLQPEAGSR